MSVWRYTAVDLRNSRPLRKQRGEVAGESAAAVRASLRRIGLQVVELRQTGSESRAPVGDTAKPIQWRSPRDAWWALFRSATGSARCSVRRYLRQRRRQERAELYDSLATMLASGLPLLEALDTAIASRRAQRSALRGMLVHVREQLRSGSSLGQAMAGHPAWFDAGEVAMVRAGQHGGTLPEVLRTLSERHERSGELTNRLVGALAYPSMVAVVGIGVVVFLSVKTLPNLAQVLTDAGVPVPALTARVMAFGQLLADHWIGIGLAAVLAFALGVTAARLAARWGLEPPSWMRRLYPKVLRRTAVARLALQLAELLRTGVPLVEALRVLAPTAAASTLRRRLLMAADLLERGNELSAALSDDLWFDTELRRLLDIGQASGEVEVLLERIGHRYARQADRLIDRFTVLLEPCVILMLAFLVGIVVMAAILPLLQLQEIL